MAQQLEQAITGLLSWLADRDWKGYDPYDALRTAPVQPFGRFGRQALVQIYKHSPIDLRRVTGAEAYPMAKAYAVGVSAAVRLEERALAERLADGLTASRLEGGLWGYEFDVQTRWAFYPAGSPNVIASSFALHGLLDLGGRDEVVAEAADALVGTFLQDGPGGPFFAYVLGSDTLIHNANLLAAAALARAGRIQRRTDWQDLAVSAARVSVAAQRADGSWEYGVAPNLRWIDGFHTAYNLMALQMLDVDEFRATLVNGSAYYVANLFDAGGRARLRADHRGFLEVHTVATALWCLATLSEEMAAAREVLRGCLSHALRLRRPDGAFGTTSINRIPYLRWGQAHMLLGLASAAKALER